MMLCVFRLTLFCKKIPKLDVFNTITGLYKGKLAEKPPLYLALPTWDMIVL